MLTLVCTCIRTNDARTHLHVESVLLHVTHQRERAADRVGLGLSLDLLRGLADRVVAGRVELAGDALEGLASPGELERAGEGRAISLFDGVPAMSPPSPHIVNCWKVNCQLGPSSISNKYSLH